MHARPSSSTPFISVAIAVLLLSLLAVAPPAGADGVQHASTPSKVDGLEIWMSIYQPTGSSPDNPVPVVLHSHGFGGTRTSAEGAFDEWLDAGFAVVSFDQRGFGETGGTYEAMNPDFEGQDVQSVIDFIATLDFVKKDRDADGQVIEDDPVLGAIGGSYGGGYQTVGALTEIRDTGSTRFNAIAPEITWHNIAEGLAPADVPRALWVSVLTAVSVTTMPDEVRNGLVQSYATGTMPNGEIPGTPDLADRFYRSSPEFFADNDIFLDIPVLFGHGTSDNLLPLNHAFHNYEDVLTDQARADSLVVGYNGGHGLPSLLPLGTVDVQIGTAVDACSPGGFAELTRQFFARVFDGDDPSDLMPSNYSITDATGSGCLHVDRLDDRTAFDVGEGIVTTPSSTGAPLQFPVLEGPATVVGIPVLRGDLTALGAETRGFFGLSVGATPATARLVQNNVLPLRQRFPAIDAPLEMELPGVAVEIPAGESLYLTATAVSDMFLGNNRYPGALLIQNAEMDVPLAAPAEGAAAR